MYGENAVVHMMKGKAVQRAFRGHQLVDQCLTRQVVNKILEDDPTFEDSVEELQALYKMIETGEGDLDSVLESDCVLAIYSSLTRKKDGVVEDIRNCQVVA